MLIVLGVPISCAPWANDRLSIRLPVSQNAPTVEHSGACNAPRIAFPGTVVRTTSMVPCARTPFILALMKSFETPAKGVGTTENVPEVAPSGMVNVVGMFTTRRPCGTSSTKYERARTAPPGGAGAFRVTVAVAVWPGCAKVGFNTTDTGIGELGKIRT